MIVNALILLLLIIAAGYGAFWFIDQGVPAPMQWIAKLIVAILGLLAIVTYVLPAMGVTVN